MDVSLNRTRLQTACRAPEPLDTTIFIGDFTTCCRLRANRRRASNLTEAAP